MNIGHVVSAIGEDFHQAKQDVSIGEDTNILSYDDFDQMSQYAIPALQWACGAGVINGKFGMLELLASHQEQVFTFAQLYEKLWPDEYLDGKNSVVCQVQRLRGKLPQGYIESVRDVGYRMNTANKRK